jgi:hypothetical protein
MNQKIEKNIHQIWCGPHPLPEKFNHKVLSWKKLNPEFNYKLWTNNELQSTFPEEYKSLVGNPRIVNINTYVIASDFFRFKIVNTFGGMYFDVDLGCVTPINEWSIPDYNFWGVKYAHCLVSASFGESSGGRITELLSDNKSFDLAKNHNFLGPEYLYSKFNEVRDLDPNWGYEETLLTSLWYPSFFGLDNKGHNTYTHDDNYHSSWYPGRVNPITDTIN